jgi:hypothetical protein
MDLDLDLDLEPEIWILEIPGLLDFWMWTSGYEGLLVYIL